MKILLFGTMTGQHTRNTFLGMLHCGVLHSFHTRTVCIEGSWLYRLRDINAFSLLKRRIYPNEAVGYIHAYWSEEIFNMIMNRVGLTGLAKRWFDPVGSSVRFDKKVARYVERHHKEFDAVYGYEDTSSFTFTVAKHYGIRCIYELPIGYWRAKERILGEVIRQRPDWEKTISLSTEPTDKLRRKDREIELADEIIVPSQFVKNTLEYYPGKLPVVKIVQYGAPTNFNEHLTPKGQCDKIKILYCGNMSQRKGLADVLDAVERTSDKVELTLIGSGNMACKPLREGLTRHRHIHSVSHEELLQIMREQDIFFFPSYFEGFALVVFDAMSQGLPLITTSVTCGPIKNGKDGWIVQPGDVDGMVTLINHLANHRDEITKCSKAALATAKNNGWDVFQDKIVRAVSL